MSGRLRWAPVAIMGLAVIAVEGVDSQSERSLRAPLEAVVPASLAGLSGRDLEVSAEEQRVAGMTEYLLRAYRLESGAGALEAAFTLYVGYYASQTQGRTIHSPKNCLPGAGWEALSARRETVATPQGLMTVNRYLLQRAGEQALVLYWYQGRGRVEASEYRVKWDLLRDSLLRGRSEEALVRVVVPVTSTEEEAFRLASGVAGTVRGAVARALPTT